MMRFTEYVQQNKQKDGSFIFFRIKKKKMVNVSILLRLVREHLSPTNGSGPFSQDSSVSSEPY